MASNAKSFPQNKKGAAMPQHIQCTKNKIKCQYIFTIPRAKQPTFCYMHRNYLLGLYKMCIEIGVRIWYYMGAGRKGDSDVQYRKGKTNTLTLVKQKALKANIKKG